MLNDLLPLLKTKSVNYIFISTHSDKLHYDCLKLLRNNSYRIIASSDFETETFCYDGIIVACPESNTKIPYVSLGRRKNTSLIKY